MFNWVYFFRLVCSVFLRLFGVFVIFVLLYFVFGCISAFYKFIYDKYGKKWYNITILITVFCIIIGICAYDTVLEGSTTHHLISEIANLE